MTEGKMGNTATDRIPEPDVFTRGRVLVITQMTAPAGC